MATENRHKAPRRSPDISPIGARVVGGWVCGGEAYPGNRKGSVDEDFLSKFKAGDLEYRKISAHRDLLRKF